MCIFPWPFYETYILFNYTISGGIGTVPRTIVAEYFLGDFFLAIMFFRVWQILRSVLNYCLYTDAFSKKLCETYGFKNSFYFAIKCLLRIYPAKIILLNFALWTLLYAYLLRLFELPVLKHIPASYETLDQYFNAVYVTVITITTVGYGDITPISYFGRATMMMAALHGALMISLVVLTVSNFLELSDNELLVFRKIQSTQSASTTIMTALRYYISKKKYYVFKICQNPKFATKTTPFLELVGKKKTW